ncbi:MAG: hypothetical protein WCA94_04515 [Candidatus Acidiferrum sp.]
MPLFSARRLAQTRRDDAAPNSNNFHPKRSERSAFLFPFSPLITRHPPLPRIAPKLLRQLRRMAAKQSKPYQTLIHELLEKSARKVA